MLTRVLMCLFSFVRQRYADIKTYDLFKRHGDDRLKLVGLATDRFLAKVVKNAKDLGEQRVGDKRTNLTLSMEVLIPLIGPHSDLALLVFSLSQNHQDVAESLRSKGVKVTKPPSSSDER
jgi:hypothetical protein